MLNRGIKLLQRGMLSLSCSLLMVACATADSAPVVMVERVIVQFKAKPAAPEQALTQLAQRYQLPMQFERELGGGFYVAQLKPAQSAAKLQPVLQQIALDPAIASIEADQLMHTMPLQ
ncbi:MULTISPECIES: hypothetical protein [Deefgea]|uniref:Uncharacterized protein n=1 Tax=Deefgea chitinilytica TaxID=570276 RepID=A0ABS2CDS8_9NEIS|nr:MULTISPECIES: hypothetical protein [Deefgea]MBM5572217.1 hypothetical protein [Deefgea chitinilytica]MBM9889452.1 hypothetical protein [Deefgea sp. CFH1-16]